MFQLQPVYCQQAVDLLQHVSYRPYFSLCPSADGTAILWRLDEPFAPVSKLTGPDIDRVTSIRIHGNNIYTSCRDGCVRVYSTNDITH